MRICHSKHPLPRNWRGLPGADRAVLIGDIIVSRRSRLRMKLLIFKTNRDMCRFYREGLRKEGLCRYTLGFVNPLVCEHQFFPGKGQPPKPSWLEVDPRYFAVMCMVQSELCMEVVTHEAVHAAYAYAYRVKKKWPNHENPEERICYPASLIAKHVNAAVHDAGLYPG